MATDASLGSVLIIWAESGVTGDDGGDNSPSCPSLPAPNTCTSPSPVGRNKTKFAYCESPSFFSPVRARVWDGPEASDKIIWFEMEKTSVSPAALTDMVLYAVDILKPKRRLLKSRDSLVPEIKGFEIP